MRKSVLLVLLVLALLFLCACGDADVNVKINDIRPSPTVPPTLAPEPTPAPSPKASSTPEPEVIILDPAEPEAQAEQVRSDPQREYVLNTKTMKFHYPSCSSVEDIKAENRKDFSGSRDEVINMGYQPCKKCNP